MNTRLTALYPAAVCAGPEGKPHTVQGEPVANVREEWLVEDRWWGRRPLRRRYFELVLADGRNAVVFEDRERGGWYAQRA